MHYSYWMFWQWFNCKCFLTAVSLFQPQKGTGASESLSQVEDVRVISKDGRGNFSPLHTWVWTAGESGKALGVLSRRCHPRTSLTSPRFIFGGKREIFWFRQKAMWASLAPKINSQIRFAKGAVLFSLISFLMSGLKVQATYSDTGISLFCCNCLYHNNK